MKRIAILGSTGSIGVNSLRVIAASPGEYEILALAAGRNIELLSQQIARFSPKWVSVADEKLAQELKGLLSKENMPKVLAGKEGSMHVASLKQVDLVISAMAGAAGLVPTFEAVKAGKDIALANKETMVMAGSLVTREAEKRGSSILPVDSEHSAILQSMQGHSREDLRRVILTASGGPFRDLSLEDMAGVTPKQALDHPNWDMGRKISIDSATMMNKGLEAIEAKWLFDLEMKQISILIHPQSIVHSMVEYQDGSVIAHLGTPDMRIPISYALSYPRHVGNGLPPLDLEKIGMLSFEGPDTDRFRCLELALRAAEIGESMPAVLNGANEIAVESFLNGTIGFLDIQELIEKTMNDHSPYPVDSIDSVLKADAWARDRARSFI